MGAFSTSLSQVEFHLPQGRNVPADDLGCTGRRVFRRLQLVLGTIGRSADTGEETPPDTGGTHESTGGQGIRGNHCRGKTVAQTTRRHSPKKAHEDTVGEFIILEFKHMSNVTDQYIVRARQVAEYQYGSSRKALSTTLQHQEWVIKQVAFYK
jgi:hypothetical protein